MYTINIIEYETCTNEYRIERSGLFFRQVERFPVVSGQKNRREARYTHVITRV